MRLDGRRQTPAERKRPVPVSFHRASFQCFCGPFQWDERQVERTREDCVPPIKGYLLLAHTTSRVLPILGDILAYFREAAWRAAWTGRRCAERGVHRSPSSRVTLLRARQRC